MMLSIFKWVAVAMLLHERGVVMASWAVLLIWAIESICDTLDNIFEKPE